VTPPDVQPERRERRPDEFLDRYRARTEEQNAAARATLEPLAPGERPWPLRAAVTVAVIAGVVNLCLLAAGARVGGETQPAGPVVLFSAVMLVCGLGMWRLWPHAVLAFMALLAIVIVLFSLFLVEASNLLGLLVPPIFIIGAGYLFWKLVRVLGRMQAPARGDG
jgi:hypothetical protein